MAFRVLNAVGPVERATVVERAGVVEQVGSFSTQGKLKAVVHGTLTNGGSPATLIVVQFKFQGAKANRRARRAEVSLEFRNGPKVGPAIAPEVIKISPRGEQSISSVCSWYRLEFVPSCHLGSNITRAGASRYFTGSGFTIYNKWCVGRILAIREA